MIDQPVSPGVPQKSEEDLSGIQEHFHPLARKVGADLFRFVYASNVFQHAVNELLAASGDDPRVAVHLRIMGDMYNRLTEMLVKDRSWTQGQIEAANRGAEEVLRGKIIIARAGDRRLLDS